jgi:hypothetical protein
MKTNVLCWQSPNNIPYITARTACHDPDIAIKSYIFLYLVQNIQNIYEKAICRVVTEGWQQKLRSKYKA